MFKACSSYLHGTRGFMNQIKENLIDQQELKSNLQSTVDEIEDEEMKSFLLAYHKKKVVIDTLLYKMFFDKKSSDLSLFNYISTFRNSESIYTSERAIIQKIGKYARYY
jgi:hypothetical protein